MHVTLVHAYDMHVTLVHAYDMHVTLLHACDMPVTNTTINGERFAGLNFRVFRGFQEHRKSLP